MGDGGRRRGHPGRRVVPGVLAGVVVLGALAAAGPSSDGAGKRADDAPHPAPRGATQIARPVADPAPVPVSIASPEPATAAPPRTDRERAFAEQYPAQWRAMRDDTSGGDHWAVLVGINEHLGAVGDNRASRQDADRLSELLLAGGWRADHVVLLTDTDATGAMIREALAWLGRKTGPDSTVVVHYSGHSKKWYGQDHDGDGEVTDEGWWPTDDDFVVDSEIVAALNLVRADRLWLNVAACNAAGFADPGLAAPGRLLTFSSAEDEKSYEDPAVGFSVWGDYLLDDALLDPDLDTDGDGAVSVQEAFPTAARAAAERTALQRPHGPQHPVMVDDVIGPFVLEVTDSGG